MNRDNTFGPGMHKASDILFFGFSVRRKDIAVYAPEELHSQDYDKGEHVKILSVRKDRIKIKRDKEKLWVSPEHIYIGIDNNTLGFQVSREAWGYVGYPYQWGAQGPESFDCSGLCFHLYKGRIALSPSSHTQWRQTKPINEIRPGDLLFYNTDGTVAGHVAIYVGNGYMVHAQNAMTGVVVTHIENPWYWNRFTGARRP